MKQRIESNEFQEKRLYFGHFLGGMSAKNDKGIPDADNYMKLDKFPKYVRPFLPIIFLDCIATQKLLGWFSAQH